MWPASAATSPVLERRGPNAPTPRAAQFAYPSCLYLPVSNLQSEIRPFVSVISVSSVVLIPSAHPSCPILQNATTLPLRNFHREHRTTLRAFLAGRVGAQIVTTFHAAPSFAPELIYQSLKSLHIMRCEVTPTILPANSEMAQCRHTPRCLTRRKSRP